MTFSTGIVLVNRILGIMGYLCRLDLSFCTTITNRFIDRDRIAGFRAFGQSIDLLAWVCFLHKSVLYCMNDNLGLAMKKLQY